MQPRTLDKFFFLQPTVLLRTLRNFWGLVFLLCFGNTSQITYVVVVEVIPVPLVYGKMNIYGNWTLRHRATVKQFVKMMVETTVDVATFDTSNGKVSRDNFLVAP